MRWCIIIKIPEQLDNPSLQFILLGSPLSKNPKRPTEKDYYTKNNYNNLTLKPHLSKHNYGIITGKLVIIDFDSVIFQGIIKRSLPPTFVVRSAGKGLLHYYYWVDIPFKTIKVNLGKERIADVLGIGNYVVGPNCMNGLRKYEIVNDVSIRHVKSLFLLELFSKWRKKDPVGEVYVKPKDLPDKEYYDCWDILDKTNNRLTVTKKDGEYIRGIDPKYGITRGNPHNFMISRGGRGWYSFHSGVGGNPTQLLMYLFDLDSYGALTLIREWRSKE